ncbi:peptidylprolyl isomerase [Paramuribaculum intestinale]|jgi:FKBP-type peptidyl-prolyl cis-trans isomerase SlyD|uniref:FKBP-type peptidyl-prolyl cis-trans isomerase n=1 Tax=Paramuribaculum intestinale TaxID=2094151 RepID=UPI000F4AF468|nr:FKBP-type peptidyl-prolyl cis-trans isomerase [Paramuribaculum intestinale]MCX4330014.1 FKBP-type peptidyl-prolyl cis-trans isomerase [Paramuribaculum intestinale]ROS94576.1 peptidylprolyl isomerase [Muribaculaceae bacterium Isolate-043 (Harlan)]ROT16700.1 peptidylprolyl isomerase [Muribaculaceae bacterium Isolate-105 (HZI)]
MEKIQPGKYVELGYDLYEVTPAGENLVHQTDAQDPEKIIFGVTPGMIRPLEKAIEGLEAGGEFDVTVKAAEAFGPHDPDQVARLEKDVFAVDGKFDAEMVKKGAVLPMMTSDGYRINGLVVDVTDDEVEMDFNHPLAGKDVRFKGSIITVRDATPEELQPAHGCGCGCHHGGEDSCGCHGDGTDSCGCSDHEGCGCH